jgi:hypothetical protein
MSILKKMGIKMDRDSFESLKKSAEETYQILLDMNVDTKDPQPNSSQKKDG